jgi:hypothetical protein
MILLAAPKLAITLAKAGWGAHLLDSASVRLIESEDFCSDISGGSLR